MLRLSMRKAADRRAVAALLCGFAVTGGCLLLWSPGVHGAGAPRYGESEQEANAASAGCVSCHVGIEHPNMHAEETVVLGCADCHGGNASVMASGARGSAQYEAAKRKAHVQPRLAANAARAGHPVRAYTDWVEESSEFVRFVNPGDLRAAPQTCGVCHAEEVRNV